MDIMLKLLVCYHNYGIRNQLNNLLFNFSKLCVKVKYYYNLGFQHFR